MKARVIILALVTLAVGSQAALGVCGPPTARTLAVTDSARIYAQPAVRAGGPVKIVGCHLESGGAPVPLATQLTRKVKAGKRTVVQRISVQVPRINGAFGAIAVRNFDALGRGRTTIRVVDLRTGATVFTSRKTAGSGRPRDWNVSDLVVSSDGRGGWITVYRPDPSQSQVWIHGLSGDQPIDSGPIDPLSLEVVETPNEAGGIDAGINYTKAGGTEPGNSGLG